MSIETTDKKLSEFPFPSITICNQNKLSKTKMDRLLNSSSKFELLTAEQIALLFLVVIRAEEAARHADQLNSIHDYLRDTDTTIEEVINITTQVRTCYHMCSFVLYFKSETFCLTGNGFVR